MSYLKFRQQIFFLLLVFIPLTVQGQNRLNSKSAQALLGFSKEYELLSETVSPAIVQILATGYTAGVSAEGGATLTKQRSTGSGVLVDPSGYIITNNHVVHGARRLLVAIAEKDESGSSVVKPRSKVYGAQLIGRDSETDLAVLKVQGKNLPFLVLGDSEKLQKGQMVFAFGSPLGLENSATMGIISSVARQLRTEDPMIYIQTDASINPGSSGGPLVDVTGQVVGINTMIFSQSGGNEGIGFAAPSNIVSTIYKQLKENGRVARGQIGVYVQTISPVLADALKLPATGNVIVADVVPYSPADKAGMRIGDIVLSLDNKLMENGRQFIVNVYGKAVGQSVLIEIQRKEVKKTLKIEVVERPDDLEDFIDMVSPRRNLVPAFGILGLDLNDMIRQMLPPLRIDSGVVVANRANLLYDQDTFVPGDVIHFVNSMPVESLEDLRRISETLRTYDPVVVQVERFGAFRYVAFEME